MSKLRDYLENAQLVTLTPNTLTTKAALRRELGTSRQRGWFLNREESQEGLTTISAWFLRTSSIYIVTVAGPTSRLAPKLERAAELLVQVCMLLGSSGRTTEA